MQKQHDGKLPIEAAQMLALLQQSALKMHLLLGRLRQHFADYDEI